MTQWDIPSLDPLRLATVIPTTVYGGGALRDPATTLCIWRTTSVSKARGMTVGFYVDDSRLEPLWRQPERILARFLSAGVTTLIEPDFSLWRDDPVVVQLYNTYRTRWLGRYWQDHGLTVIPNLTWSDERSFSFCFSGIPVGALVVACECRTPGANDTDRRAFLRGLEEGVRRVQPQHVLVYGGQEHAYWLTDHLPKGPQYTLLESFMTVRSRMRAAETRKARDKHQLNLFEGGTTSWVDAAVQAA